MLGWTPGHCHLGVQNNSSTLTRRGKREFSNHLFSFVAFYFVIMSGLQVVMVNVKNIYIGAILVDAFTVLSFAKSNTWIFSIPKCFYKAYSHFQGKIQLPLAHTEEKLPFEAAILRKQCYRAQSSGIAMHNVRAISFLPLGDMTSWHFSTRILQSNIENLMWQCLWVKHWT